MLNKKQKKVLFEKYSNEIDELKALGFTEEKYLSDLISKIWHNKDIFKNAKMLLKNGFKESKIIVDISCASLCREEYLPFILHCKTKSEKHALNALNYCSWRTIKPNIKSIKATIKKLNDLIN